MAYNVVELAAIFMISLTLFGNLLMVSGVAAHLGLNNPSGGAGATDSVDDASNESQSVETGTGGEDTLFALYQALAGGIVGIFAVINPSLRMLYNAGVPAYIVGGPNTLGFMPPIFTIAKALAITEFFRGFGG